MKTTRRHFGHSSNHSLNKPPSYTYNHTYNSFRSKPTTKKKIKNVFLMKMPTYLCIKIIALSLRWMWQKNIIVNFVVFIGKITLNENFPLRHLEMKEEKKRNWKSSFRLIIYSWKNNKSNFFRSSVKNREKFLFINFYLY